MEITSVVSGIVHVAACLKRRYDDTMLNKGEFGILATRVEEISAALKINEGALKQSHLPALKRLSSVLEKIQRYSQSLFGKKWYTRFIRAGTHSSDFLKFHRDLDSTMQQLDLQLSLSTYSSGEEYEQIRKADQIRLEGKLDEILKKYKRLRIIRRKRSVTPKKSLPDIAFEKLRMHAHRCADEEGLEQLEQFYVSLNAEPTEQSRVRESFVESVVDQFLDSKRKVCYLLGPGGSGKTTFTELLEQRLWRLDTLNELDDAGELDAVELGTAEPGAKEHKEEKEAPLLASGKAVGDAAEPGTKEHKKEEEALLSASDEAVGDDGSSCDATLQLIPIRIDLTNFTADQAETSLRNYLKHRVGLLPEEITALQHNHNLHFLIIFDGLDEIRGGGLPRLYRCNNLDRWGAKCQMLVSCRTEYLQYRDFHAILGPSTEENASDDSLESVVWHVAPLAMSQVDEYLNRQDAAKRLGRPISEYKHQLKNNSSLRELITTPFYLKLFVDAYPELTSKASKAASFQDDKVEEGKGSDACKMLAPSIVVTANDLYQAFTQARFRTEKFKLQRIRLATEEVKKKGEIEKELRCISQAFAFEMYVNYSRNVLSFPTSSNSNSLIHGSDDEEEAIDDDLDDSTPLVLRDSSSKRSSTVVHRKFLRGCPLKRNADGTYSFLHHSFYEYFVSDKLWQALVASGKGNSNADAKALRCWGVRCMTQQPNVPVIVDLLSERLRFASEPEKRERIAQLYRLVHLSKLSRGHTPNDSHMQAAANAMTVLNFALVSFVDKDMEEPGFFRGIQVPYAWLQTAELMGVDMHGSNLSFSVLQGAKLEGANLSNCTLKGVHLNQLPVLYRGDAIVKQAALSPDGKQFALGHGLEGRFQMVGMDGFPIDFLSGGQAMDAQCLAYSPIGDLVASGSVDHTVRLWKLNGLPESVRTGHTSTVTCLAFSPGGEKLASGSCDRTVRLWDLEGSPPVAFRGHKDRITCLAYSPRGDQFASGSEDNTVGLWFASGPPGLSLIGHTGAITSLAFAPVLQGKQLASGSRDHTVRLWELDGKPGPVLFGHTDEVTCVAYSSILRQNQIASGSRDHTIRIWNMDGDPGPVLIGHTDEITCIMFSARRKQLASGSKDCTVRLWSADGQPLTEWQGGYPVVLLRFSLAEEHLWSVTERQIDRFPMSLSSIPSAPKFATSSCIAYSPTGDQLATVDASGVGLRFWSAAGVPGTVLEGNESVVTCLVYAPDGRQLASGHADGTVRLWDVNGNPELKAPSHGNAVLCLAYSPGGHHLAFGEGNNVRLWSTDGSDMDVLRGHMDTVTCVAFSPDRSYLAAGCRNGVVHLWDANGDRGLTLSGHAGGATAIAFSPSGQLLACGSRDHSVRVWERDGRLSMKLNAHTEHITCLVYLPTNELVSGSADNSVRVWNSVGRETACLQLRKAALEHSNGSKGIIGLHYVASDNCMILSTETETHWYRKDKLQRWRRCSRLPVRTTLLEAQHVQLAGAVELSEPNASVFHDLGALTESHERKDEVEESSLVSTPLRGQGSSISQPYLEPGRGFTIQGRVHTKPSGNSRNNLSIPLLEKFSGSDEEDCRDDKKKCCCNMC